MSINQLVWLRNDLRVLDNPALFRASNNGAIRVVYIVSPEQSKLHNVSDASISLKLAVIKELANHFETLGIELDILEVDLFANIADELKSFCLKNKIKCLWFNKETPHDENLRDKNVTDLLKLNGIEVKAEPYDLIVSQPVYNLSGKPFKVFTAFYRRWLDMLQNQNNTVLPAPKSQTMTLKNVQNSFDFEASSFEVSDFRNDLWPTKTEDIEQRLQLFCKNKMFQYHSLRDYPNSPATSLLSPYLAFGMLGPRHCLNTVIQAYSKFESKSDQNWQNDPWLRELAWRDFYRQLMIHFPHTSKGRDFKNNTEQLPWRKDETNFNLWCKGLTGFPIVDAAMRQLNQTGWMHNRLRMVAAGFLTKLLFINWRLGEKYFMQNLVDGEFSANNGGWQWSASTGCDSVPYFRIFNPTLQSEKFDKSGDFIRKFVPELDALDSKSIHTPSKSQRLQCGYPLPIIDYKQARIKAIDIFKRTLNN